jgi:solute carrier family 25 thiamine pyrophosphate transporter 19
MATTTTCSPTPAAPAATTTAHLHGNPSTGDAATAGAVSGFVARALLQPLDVLKIRMQLAETKPGGGAHPSLLTVTTDLVRREGVYGMWKGHVPAQLLSIGYGAVQFASYAVMCEAAGVDPSRKVKSGRGGAVFSWHFVLGGLSGMVATAANHPLDTVRTRVVFNRARVGVARVALDTLEREGLAGLYRGVGPSVVQIFPYSGFQFGYYRLLQHALGGVDWLQP